MSVVGRGKGEKGILLVCTGEPPRDAKHICTIRAPKITVSPYSLLVSFVAFIIICVGYLREPPLLHPPLPLFAATP